jgi:hypothetical protein
MMASRIQNRRALRVPETDEAPAENGGESEVATVATKRKRKASTTPAKARKPRAKKQPPRICAHWCIFDNSMKQIALFDYNQHSTAVERLATIQSTRKGAYWMQIVKLPMTDAEMEPISAAASAEPVSAS